jgi:hypothetical protein
MVTFDSDLRIVGEVVFLDHVANLLRQIHDVRCDGCARHSLGCVVWCARCFLIVSDDRLDNSVEYRQEFCSDLLARMGDEWKTVESPILLPLNNELAIVLSEIAFKSHAANSHREAGAVDLSRRTL